jgi:hypothetical protein
LGAIKSKKVQIKNMLTMRGFGFWSKMLVKTFYIKDIDLVVFKTIVGLGYRYILIAFSMIFLITLLLF